MTLLDFFKKRTSTDGFLQVPDTIKLEAAATVPSAYACAGLALFHHLGLELPDRRESSKNARVSDEPILVYGGSSNVGQFAIQLLKLSGYLNIITVASSVHHDYLKSLGARYAVDYQVPDAPGDKTAPIVAGRILQFAGGTKPKRIIDAVSSKESQQVVTAMLGDEPGKVALTMPKATGWSGNVQVFETCTDDLFKVGSHCLCRAAQRCESKQDKFGHIYVAGIREFRTRSVPAGRVDYRQWQSSTT